MKKKRIKIFLMCLVLFVVGIISVKIVGDRQTDRKVFELENGTLSDAEANELITQFNAIMHKDSKYPSYYGGMYLEKQNLVILLVEDAKIDMELRQFLEQEEGIVVRYVKYSLMSLQELQKDINSRYKKYYKKESMDKRTFLDDFSGTDVVQKDNAVVVYIKDITNNKIKQFKSIFGDDKRIQYERGGELTLQ